MVACSTCNQWWHNQCTNLGPSQKIASKSKFACVLCFIKGASGPIKERVRSVVCDLPTDIPPPPSDLLTPTEPQADPEIHTQVQTAPIASTSEHVVIIDNIGIDRDFHKSSDIKREIARCKPDLTVSLAYPLPRGGIALVCPTPEDQQKALGTWPEGAFDSNISPHRPNSLSSHQKVIVRSVHTALSEDQVSQAFQQTFAQDPLYVRRLLNKNTKAPISLCEIACSPNTAAVLISSGLSISGTTHNCGPKKAYRVTHCYNCQAYGHVAKFCKNAQVCSNCSNNHSHSTGCTLPSKCINCGGAHSADHAKCPKYLEVANRLKARCFVSNL